MASGDQFFGILGAVELVTLDSPEMPPSSARTTATALRAARLTWGWSQHELALRLGITQTAVSLYEAGCRRIDLDVLIELARALNRPLQAFLESADEPWLIHRESELAALVEDLENFPAELEELRRYQTFLHSNSRRSRARAQAGFPREPADPRHMANEPAERCLDS